MNWDAIGAVAELLGAIAVFLTLAYLARQISIQNRSTQVSLYDSILEGFNDATSDPKLAKLFERGMYDPDSLSSDESSQFAWLFRLYINQFIKAWQLHRKGVLDEQDYQGFIAQGAAIVQTPGGLRWAATEDENFPEFFEIVRTMEVPDNVLTLSVDGAEKTDDA